MIHSPHLKWHFEWFSHFSRAHSYVQQTDRQTDTDTDTDTHTHTHVTQTT